MPIRAHKAIQYNDVTLNTSTVTRNHFIDGQFQHETVLGDAYTEKINAHHSALRTLCLSQTKAWVFAMMVRRLRAFFDLTEPRKLRTSGARVLFLTPFVVYARKNNGPASPAVWRHLSVSEF